MTPVEDFERERAYLEQLAYRLLGSLADAEDAVQETFLRWRRAGEPALDEPRAWFTRTCTRLCLDRLKSAQRVREQYPGEWFPEPWLGDAEEDRSELDESLSLALLSTIERLKPAERAAFLLHDVFSYSFAEVAEILQLEVSHCRQLASRARRHLDAGVVRSDADPRTVERLNRAFFGAIESGDLEALSAVLAEDVVFRSDGGGKAPAALNPVAGIDRVLRLLKGVFMDADPRPDVRLRWPWFNGAPGVLLMLEGRPETAFQFQVRGGRIAAIYAHRNPDKLRLFQTAAGRDSAGLG
ncbi:MAG: RNA polymerase sigma factor SigJ [Planctomycetota bacterium]|jgi:RNA polymerase sigma-70 factor (ECF subfamily)